LRLTFYLETVREVWGKDVNLKPMGELPELATPD